ncbi:MAG: 4-(cytidine 5'-diphospho)-2-C-methyl-D-erythritol kinase [Nitrospirae bacterium]|nr:4-(cytidine 5'-diphospho)-2-C-methyl-D-erythritol kinase [Nitrospirota bacterium]
MLVLRAPAKINWCLYVLGKRPDGYHEIWSVMQKISLYDTLQIKILDKDQISVVVEPDIEVKPEENLVYRAAELLKEYTGFKGGARIYVKKEIPLQAGLGGGSTDAAYTLMGLNRLWGLGLGRAELINIGAEIGSDVPFFFTDSIAVVSGRGETVEPIKGKPEKRLLLIVKPGFGMSTKRAYQLVKPTSLSDKRKLEIIEKIIDKDLQNLAACLRNDLEPGVIELHPVIKEIKIALTEAGALGALMSGSGSAVFGLFRDHVDAAKAMEKLTPEYWCKIVETIVG